MRVAWGVLLACAVLAPASASEWACGDGLDDDGDALVDCADPDCIAAPECARVDHDRDGAPNEDDCAPLDPSAFAVPPAIPRLDLRRLPGDEVLLAWIGVANRAGSGTRYDVATGEVCDGSYDDNQDGLIDCEEPSCTDDLACPELCANGIDDDADGLYDCADPECTGPPC